MQDAIRLALVEIGNVWIFVTSALALGVPIWLWRRAWRQVKASHEAEIRRDLTELTMSGKVKRRIEGSKFTYYPPDDRE